MLALALVLLAIPASAAEPPASVNYIATDKTAYAPGDQVTVTGYFNTTANVGLQVTNPKGTIIYMATAKGPEFAKTFKLPADSVLGNYTLVATAANQAPQIACFTVSTLQTPPPATNQTTPLPASNQTVDQHPTTETAPDWIWPYPSYTYPSTHTSSTPSDVAEDIARLETRLSELETKTANLESGVSQLTAKVDRLEDALTVFVFILGGLSAWLIYRQHCVTTRLREAGL